MNIRLFYSCVFILVSVISHAQNYVLEYDVNFAFDRPRCFSKYRYHCTMYYTTMNEPFNVRTVDAFRFFEQTGESNPVGSIKIPASSGPIRKLWIETDREVRAFGRWFTDCGTGQTITVYENPGTSITNAQHCFDLSSSFIDWGCLSFCTDVTQRTFKCYIEKPTVQTAPENTDKIIPTNEKVILQATPGFFKNIYTWKRVVGYRRVFGFDFPVFQDLPPTLQSNDHIEISATDLYGASAEDSIGKTVKIATTVGCVTTDIITLSIRLSAPHITNAIITPPKCFGETNGSLKIKFDRPLKRGETLNILLDEAKAGPQAPASDVMLAADTSYTWPRTLASGNYKITLNGSYPNTGIRTYTDANKHKYYFSILEPPQINLTTTKQNEVRCFGGNDGTVTITATGGTGKYKIAYRKNAWDTFAIKQFSFPASCIVNDLSAGTYTFRIADDNDCYPKDISGNEIMKNVTITQPTEPLAIDNSEITDPLGYGRTDGKIIIKIKGGTKKGDGSYTITWKKEDGTVLSSVSNTNLGATYQSELQNIGKGKYIVNIADANFSVAASGATQGCMLQDTFIVHEPLPIVINIAEQKSISCNRDGDGELVAHVSGGVPYITGAPYKYKWYKKEATDIDLNITDSIATDLVTGDYYVVTEDRNLIKKTSTVFTLKEPDSLHLQFNTQANICTDKGNITAMISGGTAPYHIEWTTDDTTAIISNVDEGHYVAYVVDAHGCSVQSSTRLTIPQGIKIDNALTQNPTYYNSKDGSIQLSVSGGNPPYTYSWSNGATTKDIQNLLAGSYSVIITDASGCTQTQSYSLQNPPRIIQTGGAPLGNGITTKTLCNGQQLAVDATINDNAATYRWNSDNGFSANTAKVTLTNIGKYWITVTDSRGVNASDTLIIKQSNANINASFVVSTQAFRGEKVTFVNISYPAPERISWLIPNDTKIETIQNNQNVAELIFKDTGTYTISMKAFIGECEQVITKKVMVVEGSKLDDIGQTQNPFVKEFSIAPNPNSGQFNVKIVLQEQAKIRLRMMNVSNNTIINDKELSGSSQYIIPYTINAAAGMYILLLETPKGNQMQKIIIN